MIVCNSLENGYIEYECSKYGKNKKVAFSCKSRFCTFCSKVYVDQRAENMTNKLIKDKHRQVVFTIPQELGKYFQKDRKLLPRAPANVLKV